MMGKFLKDTLLNRFCKLEGDQERSWKGVKARGNKKNYDVSCIYVNSLIRNVIILYYKHVLY